MQTVMQKADLSERLVKWAIELNEHDIKMDPRNAIWAQVVADFIPDSLIKKRKSKPRRNKKGTIRKL